MRIGLLAFALLSAATVTSAQGCRRDRRGANSAQGNPSAAYGLGNEDPDKRKDAAEALREDGGPPPDAVPHLLAAVQRETDRDALAEMLITLGASGSPDARPVLDAHLANKDGDIREAAEKGLQLWSKKSGQPLPANAATLAKLASPEWKDRREAAEDLGEEAGPPRDAVPALVTAASKETNPKALGAMLLTLGKSGAAEAKPLIEGRLADGDSDLRRSANKAMKAWLAKNGTQVRKDVETPQTQPPAAAATTATAAAAPTKSEAPSPPPPDGCDQFKSICAADPFNLDKCKSDMKALSYAQQTTWADCVNASPDPCQKAHDKCTTKAKAAPK